MISMKFLLIIYKTVVRRIEDMIRKDESNWYFSKFSPPLLLKTYRDKK